MNHKLSIIIPCYNCSETLEEAVASVYRQNIPVPYEIVMVDDASTDNTKEVMSVLGKKYADIKLFYHANNRGGGATRNTAVKNTAGDIIFCLDSDDILPDGTLGKMLNFMLEKKCDGVGINTSIKFKGRDIKNISHVNTFGYVGEKIPFSSLNEKTEGPYCPLYSTFMLTREAFDVTGGYPEEHGFDTQGFAWRFLANGLIAYTCPGAEYLHRVDFHKSYYIREYEQGKVNNNWFRVFDEFLYLFNEETKKKILSFDIVGSEQEILSEIRGLDFLAKGFEKDLRHYAAREKLLELESLSDKKDEYDLYWMGGEYIKIGDYAKAFKVLSEAKEKGLAHEIVSEKIKICEKCLSGAQIKDVLSEIEREKEYIKHGSMASLYSRVWKKMKKEIKKKGFAFGVVLTLLSLKNNISLLIKGEGRREYLREIKDIKNAGELVLDIDHGGLGDWLAFTSLPRLLKEQLGVKFYISSDSLDRLRNKDTFRLCFESNPYFKGTKKTDKAFKYQPFVREKTLWNFLTDRNGLSITENIEKQFGLKGKGVPEIYYKPNIMPDYGRVVLVDKNYISGRKLGWLYDDKSFEREIKKAMAPGDNVEYANPSKQDLFAYADMIFSCKHFITVLSGGAALAACFKKDFTAILPYNFIGGSVDAFVFKNSSGYYIK